MKEKFFKVNGIDLHVKLAGDEKNKIILFLHGFPEFWYGWKNQIPFFVEKGYYVVVPDLRGYNLSTAPKSVKEYLIEETTLDIAMLIKALESKSVIVVGHDWGGVVAWTLSMEYPELIHKLILLNIPHPKVMLPYMIKNPLQILKSAYIAFFQIPIFPEILLSMFNFKILERTLTNTSLIGTFSDEDIVEYKKAWKNPGRLKAMLNWYRALKYSKLNRDKEIETPTLMIWGKKDAFLSEGLASLSIAKCKGGQLKLLDNATHWLHHEHSDKVNNLIYRFL